MNCGLQFRAKSDSDAYFDSSEHRIKQRIIKIICAILIYGMTNGIRLLIDHDSGEIGNNMLIIGRICLLLLAAVGYHCLRRKFKKLQRRRLYINLVIGFLILASQFSLFPVLTNASLHQLNSFQLLVYGWSSAMFFFSSLFLIEYWWMGIIAILIHCVYFIIFLAMDENSTIDICYLLGAVALYVIVGYLAERNKRMHFLIERKNFKNFQAILKIFDDIAQGIMIFDQEMELLYHNKTIHSMFTVIQDNDKTLLRTIFDQVKLKKAAPEIERHDTKRITTNDHSEDQSPARLSEFVEGLLEYLSASEDNTLVVEGFCKSPINEKKTINLYLKFTQSHYMNKRVFVVNITDTTDRDALIAAEASSEYKSRLMASVSHELRTPLNATINFTEMTLSDPNVPDYAKQQWLVPAQMSSKLLLFFINDILDFSQMHANKLRMTFESKSVLTTVSECTQLLEIQAKKKGINLEIQNTLLGEDQILLTDHNRLKQVILNLLSNAVKFTFTGGISVVLEKAIPTTGNMNLKGIKITCSDTGIGISLENQRKLFKEFEKIDLGERSSINAVGVGLGLVISNNLVQRLSPPEITGREPERIYVTSKESVGTEFSFNIYDYYEKQMSRRRSTNGQLIVNLEKAELSDSESLAQDPSLSIESIPISEKQRFELLRNFSKNELPESLRKFESVEEIRCTCPKVLIADDDSFNLTALEQNLSKFRVTCDWAFHGQQALEKIMHRQTHRCCDSCKQYAVLFIDLNMPVMDGFEASKAIKEKIKLKEIDDLKIIACTAFIQESDQEKAQAAGIDAYCTKPITLAGIQEKLASIGFKFPRRGSVQKEK